MGNCLLGWPNRFTFGAITVSTQEAALPGTNLANDQGSASQAWQCPGTAARVTLGAEAAVPWRVVSLHRTNLTGSAVMHVQVLNGAATAYDSGAVPAGVVAGYGQSVLVLPPGISGTSVQIDLSDPANPDGHLNIALAYAGDAWQPARNWDYASSPGRSSQLTEAATRAGGVVSRSDWVKRTFDLSLSGIKGAEVWSRLMDLDLWSQRGNNVLFVPNPDGATINQESVFGQVKPASGVTYPNKTPDARGWRATVTERL